MLVLTRKVNECVMIGSTIQVRVLGTHKDKVRLGFVGPPEVPIHREEVYERMALPACCGDGRRKQQASAPCGALKKGDR